MDRKYVVIMVLFIFSLSAAPAAIAQVDWSEVVEKAVQSVVAIYLYDSRSVKNRTITPQSGGSGFFISQGEVITCYHVIEDYYYGQPDSACIQTYDGSIFPITQVLQIDPENDLALVKVDLPYYITPLTLSTVVPKIGEDICVLGNALGGGIAFTKGSVSRITEDKIEIRASTNPGDSGGPALNSRGEVIGIAYVKLIGEGVEGVSFIIPAKKIEAFLSKSSWVSQTPMPPAGNGTAEEYTPGLLSILGDLCGPCGYLVAACCNLFVGLPLLCISMCADMVGGICFGFEGNTSGVLFLLGDLCGPCGYLVAACCNLFVGLPLLCIGMCADMVGEICFGL